MKKIVVLFAIIAIAVMSCGRVKKTEAVPAEQDTVKVEVVADTTAAPVE